MLDLQAQTNNQGARVIAASAALALLADARRQPRAALFDVRERGAFEQARLTRAEHLTDDTFSEHTAQLETQVPIVVYCERGDVAPDFARRFTERGFPEVYIVDGGFDALVDELHAEPNEQPVPSPQWEPATETGTDFSAEFLVGDLVYSTATILNDGGVPGWEVDAVIAVPGSRGVVVRCGKLEADPRQRLYVVRFENQDGVLGAPVGCLPDELTQTAPVVAPTLVSE